MQPRGSMMLPRLNAHAQEFFNDDTRRIHRRCDRMFAWILLIEWLGCIVTALVLTPRTWIGATSYVHLHVWLATFGGGVLVAMPLYLIRTGAGEVATRQMIAVAQMLFSALVIHLTGGRIETHFHIFGSLALLAFYRDWKVLVTGTLVVAADHFLRGVFWPMSAFGAADVGRWRWVEHASWVVFEDVFLLLACHQARGEMAEIAQRQADAIDAGTDILRRTGAMAHVGGWECDLASGRLTWSDEVYRIHELEIGSPIDLPEAIAFYPPAAREVIVDVIETARTRHAGWDVELPMVTATGRTIWVRAQGEVVVANGVATKLCGAFQDITDRKAFENELRRSATHDRLTGLPNRALLHERLQSCLRRRSEGSDARFAVLFLDFDRFKLINDTLGHEAGDELLRNIARRLRANVRIAADVTPGGEFSTISRLGGDEFVVLLDRIATPDDAAGVACQLLPVLAEPHQIEGHEIVSTASIGIVMADATYANATDILRDADIAMYEAKVAGKGRFVRFDKAMGDRVGGRLRTEAELRVALANDELYLVYQPIVSLLDHRVTGMEALLRWNHPTRGVLLPDQVLPIAEETGLIIPIGEWALRTACHQFGRWQAELGPITPARMHVNLSGKQFVLLDLPDFVAGVLQEAGIAPCRLHLEITEATLIKDRAATARTLAALRRLGVKIEIAGFGAGQSALTSLNEFDVDGLKIDRTFIAKIDAGRRHLALLQAICQLARNVNMEVTAQGVETIDQVVTLQTLDVTAGQGLYFSEPLAAELATRYVRLDADARPRDGELPRATALVA